MYTIGTVILIALVVSIFAAGILIFTRYTLSKKKLNNKVKDLSEEEQKKIHNDLFDKQLLEGIFILIVFLFPLFLFTLMFGSCLFIFS